MKPFRTVLLLGLVTLALIPSGPLWAQKKTKTTSIESMLPPNTVAYVHVKASDVGKSEQFAFTRKILESAGDDTLNQFDRRFGFLFSKMDTLTVIWPDHRSTPELPSGRPEQRTAVWVVTTKEPIDRVGLMKTLLSKAVTKKHRGFDYYFDERTWSGTMFLDAQTLVYASEDSLWAILDLKADATEKGMLAGWLAETAGKHAFHVALDPTTFQKPEMLRGIPEPFVAIFKAKTWAASVDLGARRA